MAIRYLSGINVDSNTLFVDDVNNRVGIGTASPSYPLHVVGDVALQGNDILLGASGQTTYARFINAGANYLYAESGGTLSFGSNGATNHIFIGTTGNVGIGTTSPAQKLDVAGGDIILSSNATYIISKDASGNTPRMFGINPSNDTYIGPIDPYAGGAVLYGVSGNVSSQTFYTGASARLHINSAGNVGIGTTSPTQKLEVSGALVVGMTTPAPFWNALFKDFSDGSGIYISSVNGGGGKYIAGNAYYYNSLLWRSDKTVASAINLDNGTVVFYTDSGLTANTDFTPTERMRITSAGNVGIGTTTPGYRLDVNGDLNTNSGVYRIGGNTILSGTTSVAVGSSGATGSVALRTTSGDGLVLNGANVGIGTTSPQNKLTVKGATNYNLNLGLLGGYSGIYVYNDASSAYNHLRIDASPLLLNSYSGANVGIGTASPAEKLHVAGNIRGAALQVYDGLGAGVTGVGAASSGGALRLYSNGAVGLTLNTTGAIQLNDYGTGANTGTVAYNLAVDSSGNIIETAGGVVDGSGTANYVSKWSDANTLTNSLLYDNGSTISIGLGSTTPSYTNAYGYPQFAIESNAFASSHVFTHNNTNGNYSFFALGKSKGTAAAPTIVESSEIIGAYQFWAYDGSAYREMASIISNVDGTPGAGDMPGNLRFSTTSDGASSPTERMRITSAGNVGIGTTNPGAKLEVIDEIRVTSGGAYASVTTRNTGATGGGGFLAYQNGVSNAFFGVAGWYLGNTDTGVVIGTDSSSRPIRFYTNTERMRITGDGNVGIGTDSPGYKLDVQGAGGITISTNGAIIAGTELITGSGILAASSSGTDVAIKAGASTLMTLKSGGNVGIGTTSPAEKLHVEGTTDVNILVRTSGASGNAYTTYENSGDNTFAWAIGRHNAGGFYFNSSTGGTYPSGTTTTRMVIDTSGNVGIGTTAPTNIIHVVGVPRFDSPSDPPTLYNVGVDVDRYYGTNQGVLTSPEMWLKIDIDGTSYLIPAFEI